MEKQIDVIYEDDSILVINKPAGIVVNKASTTSGLTVQEWSEKRLNIDRPTGSKITDSGEYNIEYEFKSRGGVVHRLDKETSGILIIAKNAEAFGKLKDQFLGRGVLKKYIALTHGKIEPQRGTVDAPIGRLPWNRMRFGVLAEGRGAITDYKVLEYRRMNDGNKKEELTLVELYPKTGRTHQIRVHLRHIGNPIFSDELYSGRKQSKRDRKILPRHFLHASKIKLKHPRSGEEIVYESELPDALKSFLDTTEISI